MQRLFMYMIIYLVRKTSYYTYIFQAAVLHNC